MSQLVYICGPYSTATETEVWRNVERACEAGRAVLRSGNYPIIPHLTWLFDEWHAATYGARLPAETYYAWDQAVLKRCDGLLWLASSPGADAEMDLAHELGLPVFLSVHELTNATSGVAASQGGGNDGPG